VEFTDTHCHIQSAGYSDGERLTHDLWAKQPDLDRSELVARAVEHQVTKMICVGCDLADSQIAVEFAQSTPYTWASIGLHPHEAKDYATSNEKRSAFSALATSPKVVAIGECGLDYFYNHSGKDLQAAILRFQFGLAAQYNLPMIFHVRDAFDDFWPIFDEYNQLKSVRGVLHSFTDNQANLERALDNGLYIGVNGIATFAKDPQQRAVYMSIPLHNMVLETDAPFLTPVPHRGRVNTPEHVFSVANFLSELRNEPLEALAKATTANAQQLFNF
jgi:TatD DNase family protein